MTQIFVDAINASKDGHIEYVLQKDADTVRISGRKNLLDHLRDRWNVVGIFRNEAGYEGYVIKDRNNIRKLKAFLRNIHKNEVSHTSKSYRVEITFQEFFEIPSCRTKKLYAEIFWHRIEDKKPEIMLTTYEDEKAKNLHDFLVNFLNLQQDNEKALSLITDHRTIEVRFLRSQGDENLYRDTTTGDVYIRRPYTKDHVLWYTTIKWLGGYEANDPVKEGVAMCVMDSHSNALFEETLEKDDQSEDTRAKKAGEFKNEAIKRITAKMSEAVNATAKAMEKDIASQKEWEAFLEKAKEKSGDIDCMSEWLYYDHKVIKETILGTDDYLGKTACLVKQNCKHTKCGLEWTAYVIVDKDSHNELETIGYTINNEKENLS